MWISTSTIFKLPALESPPWLISANCQFLVKGTNHENLSKESLNFSNIKVGKGYLVLPKHQRSPCRQSRGLRYSPGAWPLRAPPHWISSLEGQLWLTARWQKPSLAPGLCLALV